MIPKLLVKRTNICRKCDYTLHQLEEILPKIRDGNFNLQKEIKLKTEVGTEKLIGLNELQIHAKLPIYAIRFSLSVNGKKFDDLIGDGVIIATPFGSTGYYASTGGKPFEKGIGISFNNLHNKKVESFTISEDSIVKVKINRGPALILADNNERFIELKDNEFILISKSENVAKFISVP
jgi:NAD+ kinase